MEIAEIATTFLIAVGLAMDAFTVSICVSASEQIQNLRPKLRLAGHFGIFQGGMAVLGWLAGETIVRRIEAFDHWVAFALLLYVGVHLIRSGLRQEDKPIQVDPSRGWSLVMLSVATSLDALVVGLSFAMLGTQILLPALLIGVVAFALSNVGLFAGHKLGEKLGKRMEILGGLVLVGIGLRILITHL